MATIQSGQRLTITETNAANIFGMTNDRAQLAVGSAYPQLVTGGTLQQRLGNYFNKS